MKLLAALIIASALATPVKAQTPRHQSAQFVPQDPWRAIDGATNYIKLDGVEFVGQVMDVLTNGVILNGTWGPLFQTFYAPSIYKYPDFFVENFPFQVEDGETIERSEHLMAWDAGATYTYHTIKGMYRGTSRTIHKLDYGIPCGVPPEIAKRALAAAQSRTGRLALQTRQAQTNAFHLLRRESASGDASAQYRLGMCYLTGAGTAANRDEALRWLTQSAGAGNLDASNKLAALCSTNSPMATEMATPPTSLRFPAQKPQNAPTLSR